MVLFHIYLEHYLAERTLIEEIRILFRDRDILSSVGASISTEIERN